MKRLLLALGLSLALCAPAFAELSPRDFTRTYLRILQRSAPTLTVTITADLELRAVDAEKQERIIFLQNAYQAYKQTPNDGHAVIQRYVAAVLEPINPAAADLQPDRIVPVIKDRAWLDEIRHLGKTGAGGATKTEQVWEDYNGELVIVYAEDSPKQIRYFTAEDLAKTGIKKSELRAIALKNLHARLLRVQVRGTPALYLLTAGGDYEASMLLATEMWAGGQIKVEGEIVVAVPARDVLLITGSKSAEDVATLRKKAAEIAKDSPYRLTAQLFVFRDGKFVKFSD
jgi:uncharacterized protein YtpQ (UPF0354 family)